MKDPGKGRYLQADEGKESEAERGLRVNCSRTKPKKVNHARGKGKKSKKKKHAKKNPELKKGGMDEDEM